LNASERIALSAMLCLVIGILIIAGGIAMSLTLCAIVGCALMFWGLGLFAGFEYKLDREPVASSID